MSENAQKARAAAIDSIDRGETLGAAISLLSGILQELETTNAYLASIARKT